MKNRLDLVKSEENRDSFLSVVYTEFMSIGWMHRGSLTLQCKYRT